MSELVNKEKIDMIIYDEEFDPNCLDINFVDHPDHYQGKGIEAIDVIEAFELNFALGNAIKYILRADKKANKKQDLEKALWYLKHELSKFEG
jgi:hypothetical protein